MATSSTYSRGSASYGFRSNIITHHVSPPTPDYVLAYNLCLRMERWATIPGKDNSRATDTTIYQVSFVVDLFQFPYL